MQMWDSHWHLSEAISKGDSSTETIKSNYDEIHSIVNSFAEAGVACYFKTSPF